VVSEVVLYGRPGCHLCDEARAGLEKLAGPHGFRVREVNIEGDEALHRAMLERIPVIEVGGEEVCELFLDAEAVLSALAILSA
jgi:hypothetical protein